VSGGSGQAERKKKPHATKTETSGDGRTETDVAIVVEAKDLAEHHEFPGLTAFGRIGQRG
jgi:hypothetical protein